MSLKDQKDVFKTKCCQAFLILNDILLFLTYGCYSCAYLSLVVYEFGY